MFPLNIRFPFFVLGIFSSRLNLRRGKTTVVRRELNTNDDSVRTEQLAYTTTICYLFFIFFVWTVLDTSVKNLHEKNGYCFRSNRSFCFSRTEKARLEDGLFKKLLNSLSLSLSLDLYPPIL